MEPSPRALRMIAAGSAGQTRTVQVCAILASTTGRLGGHNRRPRFPCGSQDPPQVVAERVFQGLMSTPVEITWLLAAVTKGDPVAFERLYGATCAKLFGVVLRIVRRDDLAADVMEDAYLQIWSRAGEFDPGRSAPLAWMVAIARRLAIDVARRPQPPTGDGEPEVIDDNEGPGTVPRHELTEDLKRLLTCIGRLEPDRQRMLLLAYFGAFSREQLSTKLDMPVHLLRASLRRSLAEVEQCLGS
jgi:RNA polymerase sigma-70 factor, ECF subfamily